MMRTIMAMALAIALAAPAVEAQRRPARRQPTIEIRGQVPTPQVVTVRPREVPAYSRQVLVPNFYDHDFWPSIVQPYQMVPNRMLTGAAVPDSLLRARPDSLMRVVPDSATRTDSVSTPPGAAGTVNALGPGTADSRTPASRAADTTGRSGGTAPARPPRR